MRQHHYKRSFLTKVLLRTQLYHDWHVQGKSQLKGRVILCLETLDLDVDQIIAVPWLNYRVREETPSVPV